jgi:hypothetical protein
VFLPLEKLSDLLLTDFLEPRSSLVKDSTECPCFLPLPFPLFNELCSFPNENFVFPRFYPRTEKHKESHHFFFIVSFGKLKKTG